MKKLFLLLTVSLLIISCSQEREYQGELRSSISKYYDKISVIVNFKTTVPDHGYILIKQGFWFEEASYTVINTQDFYNGIHARLLNLQVHRALKTNCGLFAKGALVSFSSKRFLGYDLMMTEKPCVFSPLK